MDCLADNILVDVRRSQFNSAVQLSAVSNLNVSPVLGGAIEDETKGCCEGTVVFDFCLVLASNCLV